MKQPKLYDSGMTPGTQSAPLWWLYRPRSYPQAWLYGLALGAGTGALLLVWHWSFSGTRTLHLPLSAVLDSAAAAAVTQIPAQSFGLHRRRRRVAQTGEVGHG
jgi:hypothetical protein